MPEERRTLDYGERGTVLVVPDGDALARVAAETLITVSAEAAAEGRQALVALSGGSTPKKMGELLASPEFGNRVHWNALQIFWGDERWVPLTDKESNAGEAIRGFLGDAPIPDENVHPWETEGDVTPDVAAERYERLIREVSGVQEGVPAFDLIFVGMGDDGHTLSLFPGTAAVNLKDGLTLAHYVDKLNSTMVTFTRTLANAAKKVVFLVGGTGKADTLHAVLDGPVDVNAYPSQVIRPESGNLLWVIDEPAAAKLEADDGA